MEVYEVLNKLAKWRTVFASWQLGTRTDTDPECKAVKDHRECTIMLRAEVSALTQLLVDKGVLTVEEFQNQLIFEAGELDKHFQRAFPGFSVSQDGVNIAMPEAAKTLSGFPK